MTDKTIEAGRGEFDEDGALHLTGLDAIVSRARKDWTGATFKGARIQADAHGPRA